MKTVTQHQSPVNTFYRTLYCLHIVLLRSGSKVASDVIRGEKYNKLIQVYIVLKT